MKKTLISIVLIVSLLSTALFSVVFAGYSVSDTETAYAVVSAFGANVTITTDFDGSLDQETSKYKKDTMSPGDSGTLLTIAATGSPTVDATITYAVDTVVLENWTVDSVFYCPIVFNVFGTEVKCGNAIDDSDTENNPGFNNNSIVDTADELIAAIKAVTYTASVNAGATLTGSHDKTITWTWPKAGDSTKDSKLTDAAALNITATASIVQN